MFDVKVNINRLESSVQAHEARGIDKGKIVFYGDSAFTRWDGKHDGNVDLEDVIRNKDGSKAVVNHGIGGSTSEELLYYYPRLIRAWEPKALVFQSYCNDRDCAYSAEEIMEIQSRIFEYARKDFPGIRIFVCDARPLKKHVGDLCWMTWYNHLKQYNELLYTYCDKHPDVTLLSHARNPIFFVDEEGVGDYNKARMDLFIDDEVHYNHEGYELYRGFFTEALADLL